VDITAGDDFLVPYYKNVNTKMYPILNNYGGMGAFK